MAALTMCDVVLPDTIKVDDLAPGGDDSVANDFYMYIFKVQPCPKRGAHDWSSCPYAHPKEKARRRDPRVYKYASTPCPESLKGMSCGRGSACPYAHSVYEYWLHPARFRTQMCKKGNQCNRTLCFFAHSASELRFPDTADDAEAAALDAAAASATAGSLPLVAPPAAATPPPQLYAAPSGGGVVLLQQQQVAPAPSSGVLLSSQGSLMGGLVGDSSITMSGSSMSGLGMQAGGLGASDTCLRLPGVAVSGHQQQQQQQCHGSMDVGGSLSDPLPRLTSGLVATPADSTSGAAWLQQLAASQLSASQILSDIRPPPPSALAQQQAARAAQQQQAGFAAAAGYHARGPAPGLRMMGGSGDAMAAGLAGLSLNGGGLVDDSSSSSSCITCVSNDQLMAALRPGARGYDGAGSPGSKSSSSARIEDMLLLQQLQAQQAQQQQNLMRLNSGASLSSSGSGIPMSTSSHSGHVYLSAMQSAHGSGSWSLHLA